MYLSGAWFTPHATRESAEGASPVKGGGSLYNRGGENFTTGGILEDSVEIGDGVPNEVCRNRSWRDPKCRRFRPEALGQHSAGCP